MKKLILVISAFLLFLGVTTAAQAVPYTGADILQLGIEASAYSTFLDGDNTPESGELAWYSTPEGAIWTAWSGLWVEYEVDLTAGEWLMGLNVTNQGDLGDGWYTQFEIKSNLSSETIVIPASDDETNFGFTNVDIASDGLYTVRYTWLNDQYSPNQGLDANIQIDSVFFDNTATPVPEPATLFLLGTGILGFIGYRRKK